MPPYYKDYPPYIKRIQAEKRRLWKNGRDPGVLVKYHKVFIKYKSAIEKFDIRQETELLKENPKICLYIFKKLIRLSLISPQNV